MLTGLYALTFVAAPGPIGLQAGDAFTYSGNVVEYVDRPDHRLRRSHELTVRMVVLEQQENWSDLAVLTRLLRTEDVVGLAAKPVTGASVDQNAPPLLRLDLVRVHSDGTCHLLLPVGPRLRLAADTPAQALRPIPLDIFAISELGMFPPKVPRLTGPAEPWTVASGGNRPNEIWVAKKLEFVNAEQCRMLVMNQHSPDWEEPVGGRTAWHRADAVWVSTEDGTARRVHRVIRQRDGRANQPSAWIQVKYDLTSRESLGGKKQEQTRRDIEAAYFALAESTVPVRDAGRLGMRLIDGKLDKLARVLAGMEPGNPYREAVLAAERTLTAAKRGDAPTLVLDPTGTPLSASHPRWPEPGQPAPNVQAGGGPLAVLRGKPVVLVFFRPASETADLSLAIADALANRYGSGVTVRALAVFEDAVKGANDARRLGLAIPVHDGSTAASEFGIESIPRFAVINAEGKVSWTFTGVGPETGGLIREELDRLTRPTLPTSLSGTTSTPVPGTYTPSVRP